MQSIAPVVIYHLLTSYVMGVNFLFLLFLNCFIFFLSLTRKRLFFEKQLKIQILQGSTNHFPEIYLFL